MGQEAICKARSAKSTSEGKAMLETDYVLFRGDFRVKMPFAAMTSIKVRNGWLELASKEADLALELGAAAAKWEHKILHPPSRAQKLGIKAGIRIALSGLSKDDFASEMAEFEADWSTKPGSRIDLVFLGVKREDDLEAIEKLKRSLVPNGAIWIVYPKGRKDITEAGVIKAIRGAGLKDVKVASFSATHTALKAVIPVEQRTQAAR